MLPLISAQEARVLIQHVSSFKAVTKGDSLVFLWVYSKGEDSLPDDALAPADLGESLVCQGTI